MLESIYLIAFFLLGLVVGSFLKVIIDRIPRGGSPLWGRSYCDHCKHLLAPLDLIPILSYLALHRCCRYCQRKISAWYPLVEVVTAVVFVIIANTYFLNSLNWFELPFWLGIASALIVVFVADLRYGIIPDFVILPSIVLSLLRLILTFLQSGYFDLEHLLAALFAALFFLLLNVVTKGKGMGLGDVKLVFLLGLVLGSPAIWIALYAAFLTGAISGVILILSRRVRLGQTIPFGPFLVLGFVTSLIWGESLLTWWYGYVG